MNMKAGRLYIDPETSEEIAKEVVKSTTSNQKSYKRVHGDRV